MEELTKEVPEDDNSEGSSNTVSDNVFKGLRDDLDFIDENDVGKLKRKQYKEFDSRWINLFVSFAYRLIHILY